MRDISTVGELSILNQPAAPDKPAPILILSPAAASTFRIILKAGTNKATPVS
jgi:hypothetical protein